MLLKALILRRRGLSARSALRGLLVGSLISMSAGASAARAEPIDVRIIDMPFEKALNYLEQELGIQFVGDRFVRERLVGLELNGSTEDIVDTVMQSVRMDTFNFNGQIYFSPSEERAVRLISLEGDISATQAMSALDAAGLIIPGFDVQAVADGAALALSGPVRYLAISEGVLDALSPTLDVAAGTVRMRRAGILETVARQVNSSAIVAANPVN